MQNRRHEAPPGLEHGLDFSMLQSYSRILPAPQFVLLNLALGIGHFLVLLNAGAYLPMLPYVSGSMGEGIAYVVWGQSDYFTAMGSAFLIARPLMQRYGPKNVAIFAYLLFSASSISALLSVSHFAVFTAIRVVQGFAAGISIIPSFFLLLEYYREEKQQTAISLWGLALFIPFSIGPALGGWLAYKMGDWRLLFFFSCFISLLVAGILWALLADWEDKTDRSASPPYRLFFLFFAAAITLQEFFDVGLLSDLSSRFPELWWLFIAFALLSWLFWFENGRSANPLVRFSLYSRPNYASGMLILCLAFMAFQGAVVQYVIRLQVVEGYTAWHAGLLFLPVFVFSKPLSILAQYLIREGADPRLLASLSFSGFSVCFWWISGYMRPATWETLLLPQFLMGAALGLFFVSMTAISLGHVSKAEQMHAVDLLNTARNLSAGLAITFSDIGWDRLSDLELNRLDSPDVSNSWRFASSFEGPARLLHEKIGLEASLLTLNDLFYLLSLFFVILAASIWLFRRQVSKDPDMTLLENLGEEP